MIVSDLGSFREWFVCVIGFWRGVRYAEKVWRLCRFPPNVVECMCVIQMAPIVCGFRFANIRICLRCLRLTHIRIVSKCNVNVWVFRSNVESKPVHMYDTLNGKRTQLNQKKKHNISLILSYVEMMMKEYLLSSSQY